MLLSLRRWCLQALFSSSEAAGSLGYDLLGLGPSIYELAQWLPEHPGPWDPVARRSASLSARNHNLRRALRWLGSSALAGLVEWKAQPDQLRLWQQRQEPVLLVGWHLGAPFALGQALSQAQLPAVFCIGPPPGHSAPAGIEFVPTDGDMLQKVRAFDTVLQALKAGQTCYLVADHPHRSRHRQKLWGRDISMSPGLGPMVEMTGAHLVPVVSRWIRHGRLQVELYSELLPEGGCQSEAFAAVGAFFEDYLRSHPEELEMKFLMKYLACEPGS